MSELVPLALFHTSSLAWCVLCLSVCSPLTVIVMPPEADGDALYRYCCLLCSHTSSTTLVDVMHWTAASAANITVQWLNGCLLCGWAGIVMAVGMWTVVAYMWIYSPSWLASYEVWRLFSAESVFIVQWINIAIICCSFFFSLLLLLSWFGLW